MRPLLFLAVLALGACRPETVEEARAEVARWLYPGAELAFGAGRGCTAAAFQLRQPFLKAGARQVSDMNRVAWHIERGEVVAMRDAAQSPDGMSRALVAADLAGGVALISAVTGPRPCLGPVMARGARGLMTTPGALLIYDAPARIVVIADLDRGLALYLRVRD